MSGLVPEPWNIVYTRKRISAFHYNKWILHFKRMQNTVIHCFGLNDWNWICKQVYQLHTGCYLILYLGPHDKLWIYSQIDTEVKCKVWSQHCTPVHPKVHAIGKNQYESFINTVRIEFQQQNKPSHVKWCFHLERNTHYAFWIVGVCIQSVQRHTAPAPVQTVGVVTLQSAFLVFIQPCFVSTKKRKS